jgi:hypothetical protein
MWSNYDNWFIILKYSFTYSTRVYYFIIIANFKEFDSYKLQFINYYIFYFIKLSLKMYCVHHELFWRWSYVLIVSNLSFSFIRKSYYSNPIFISNGYQWFLDKSYNWFMTKVHISTLNTHAWIQWKQPE